LDRRKDCGFWVWGDGHTHSYWSDGLQSIKEIVRYLREFEEDFHIQTDHMMISMPEGKYMSKWLTPDTYAEYARECLEASTSDHIVIPGVEFGLTSGSPDLDLQHGYFHILLYDPKAEVLPPNGWYVAKSFDQIVREMRERGLTVVVAHTDGHVWEASPSLEFDGFEIRYDIEERIPPLERSAFKCGHWDRMLMAGQRIPISCGSDCHQTDLWAASAMRNVVLVEDFSAHNILESLRRGRSYLSATWHPDIYLELGYKGINPEKSGGFTPWWEKEYGNMSREKARPKLEQIVSRMLRDDYGRVKRKDYPTLDFTVEGANVGDTVNLPATRKVELNVDVEMHVPITFIELIEGGKVVKRVSPQTNTYTATYSFEIPGNHDTYFRLQAQGSDENGRTEWLISNPIYISAKRSEK